MAQDQARNEDFRLLRSGLPERAAGLERMDKTACGLGPPVILKVIHSAQEANSE